MPGRGHKRFHEIRDPIHTFIRLDSTERQLLDTEPVQRLRHIHQLALSYLVYPGATHKRFEHALGTMDLAGRVFDTLFQGDDPHPAVARQLATPSPLDDDQRGYWRRVVRFAALLHDIGHLPFSHAAEHALLPSGFTHESMTRRLITELVDHPAWRHADPRPDPRDVAKVAVGAAHAGEAIDTWTALLADIITGEAFGVDRMDYLLRDAHHTGVGYGRFDHYRLIDTLRVLPSAENPDEGAPELGVDEGGLRAAESLLLARYYMYSQVYFHRIRRAYDVHLRDFLVAWLAERYPERNGRWPTDPDAYLRLTDIEVLAAIREAAREPAAAGHDPARRITERGHFRVLWERSPIDIERNPDAGRVLYHAAIQEFGPSALRRDAGGRPSQLVDFPVLRRDDTVVSARSVSVVLRNLPGDLYDVIFIHPNDLERGREWLRKHKDDLLAHTIPAERPVGGTMTKNPEEDSG